MNKGWFKKGYKMLEETKRKISNSLKGHFVSEEIKRKIGFALKGRKFSEERRRNLSIAHKGQKPSLKLLEYFKIRKGKKHPRWKGGKIKDEEGYILIYKPEHPFAIHNRYIKEHRFVIESKIKRYLLSTEQVHHINGIRNDNRIENLICFKNLSAHTRFENNKKVKPGEIIFDGRT